MRNPETTTEADSPSPNPPRPTIEVPPLRVTPNPTSSQSWSTPSTPNLDDGSSVVGDPIDMAAPPTTGDTRSSDSPRHAAAPSGSLKEIARGLVLGATVRLGAVLGKDDHETVEALAATEKEQKAIGDPLASIGARHVKADTGNPDVADLIMAGVALLGYGLRAVTTMWNIRRARRAMAAATNDPIEHDPKQEGPQHV